MEINRKVKISFLCKIVIHLILYFLHKRYKIKNILKVIYIYGNDKVQYKKTIDKDHGRGEIREYFLTYDTNKIKDKIKWKTVNALLYVKVQREEKDELKVTDNYYIIDYKIDMEEAEKVIRDHWNIEC